QGPVLLLHRDDAEAGRGNGNARRLLRRSRDRRSGRDEGRPHDHAVLYLLSARGVETGGFGCGREGGQREQALKYMRFRLCRERNAIHSGISHMADAHQKKHDYHIIDPSPWPLLASIGAFVMAFGGIAYMRYLSGG